MPAQTIEPLGSADRLMLEFGMRYHMPESNDSVLEPLHFVQKGARVLVSLRAAIVTGQLAPGQPLRDRELAAQLGVSRTPVREALFRLAATGLVIGSDRGWSVAPLTEQDIRELFELRRVLEPMGIRRLGADGSPEARERLASFFDGFRQDLPRESYPEYLECDHEFHKLIVNCSANSRIRYLYSLMEDQIHRRRHYLSMGFKGRVDQTLAEHLAICEAVERGDWAEAEDALIHHLHMGEETMISLLGKEEENS